MATTGAQSSSTEHVQWPDQHQVRSAAPPSVYDGYNNIRLAEQLQRVRTMATTISGAHSSFTERVRWQQQYQGRTAAPTEHVRQPHQHHAHTAPPPSTNDGHNRREQQLHRVRTMATTSSLRGFRLEEKRGKRHTSNQI